MKISFFKNNRQKASPQQMPTNVNKESFNKLYESLLRYFSKGQFVWNRNDLASIISNGYLFNPDVFSIINKIIQTACMVGWQMYEVKDSKSFNRYKTYKKAHNTDAMMEYSIKAFEPVDEHPMLELLEHPNRYNTGTLFDQNLLGFYLLLGNSYLNKLIVVGKGVPGELEILPAYLVKIVFGDRMNLVKGYSIDNWNDIKYQYSTEEVYHFRSFNPDYTMGQFLYGSPPSNGPTLERSNQSYQAAIALIQNMGAMGILSSGNDENLDPESAQKIKDKYYEEYGGAKNRGKMLVVGHKMEYTNLAQSITDLALIQGQEQDFLTLCRVYNVDSRIMGYVKGSTFSNMKEARQDFLQNRILPLKYMQSEAYNEFLLPHYDKDSRVVHYLDIDYKTIPELSDDRDKLSARLQNEIKKGLITPAEAAKLMGYPELADPLAQQLWIGTDMVPMNTVANRLPKPQDPKQA